MPSRRAPKPGRQTGWNTGPGEPGARGPRLAPGVGWARGSLVPWSRSWSSGMRDLGKMMKQVQKLQQDVARLQEELKAERVEATAGGGVVRAVANGHGELQEVTIDPSVVDPSDIGLLQDLVVAAVSEAQRLAKQKAEERMRGLTGGLPLPPGMI